MSSQKKQQVVGIPFALTRSVILLPALGIEVFHWQVNKPLALKVLTQLVLVKRVTFSCYLPVVVGRTIFGAAIFIILLSSVIFIN